MIALYVSSSEPYAGKSVACLVLGRRYQEMGRKVGYFKPLGMLSTRAGGVTTDEDVAFIAQMLGLREPLGTICPVLISPESLHQVFTGHAPDFLEVIDRAFATVSQDKDLMLVGGLGSACCTGLTMGLEARHIVERLGTRSLIIGQYHDETSVDLILSSKLAIGDSVLGLVINGVSPKHIERVKAEVAPFLESQGLPVFGVIPRDQVLRSMTVREVAATVGATILCCEPAADELVEHYSVGAMSEAGALRYFRRTPNKAVITGGDRSDIQLAALETSTRCIILTGDLYPDPRIITRAQEQSVPLLLTREDTLTAVERIEKVLGKLRVREPKKIQRLVELVEQNVDLTRLDVALGVDT